MSSSNTNKFIEALEQSHELKIKQIKQMEEKIISDLDENALTEALFSQICLDEAFSALLFKPQNGLRYVFLVSGDTEMASLRIKVDDETFSADHLSLNADADYDVFEELLDIIEALFFDTEKKEIVLGEYEKYADKATARGYKVK